jgi:predicted CoA-substrate-specific enzyme activase
MKLIGLDAGSVSVKIIVLDEKGRRVEGRYRKHFGHPLRAAYELLSAEAGGPSNEKDCFISITGSSGKLIASALGVEPVNEIVAQSYSIKRLHPEIKTIIELGGEDSKLIALNDGGIEDFSMNSVCAAGTGSFLDQQAERLNLTIEEFSLLALKAERPPRIAGRCSVFAKSDMIHLQQIATPLENIVAGLCFAVARNFKGSILRGRKPKEPVSFQGGVAANSGMVRAFREVLELNRLIVPPDFALMGAWGAVLKSLDEGGFKPLRLNLLGEFIEKEKKSTDGHMPLAMKGDDFFRRHNGGHDPIYPPSEKKEAYLGIDVGSISTNLAVIDKEGRLLGKRYLMTSGRPIEAVRAGLKELSEELGDRAEITAVGTTGSGRYMIADYVGADIVKNEITAQAKAAAFIDARVDTIFEIGGQDSKYISLRDGVIVDFEMNKACAAGTGSFLEEQAEKLRVSIKGEFAECAFSSECPSRLGERCTVFMENSLMASLQKGAKTEDLLAGLAYSIVQNYINRVVAGKPVGENIFFQGGVAFNKSVVAAFEKYIGKKVTVPPHHDVTGAIGMALIAKEHMKEKGGKTTFKGIGLWEKPYALSSFECGGCPNVCEINRVKIEGEESFLFYGGRCEKYDIRKKKTDIENLFSLREELLWRHAGLKPEGEGIEEEKPFVEQGQQPIIGIPYIFYFHDYLPFWSALLKELGYGVVVSSRTNRRIINSGLEGVLSEACFPIKVAHGHIRRLAGKGIREMLMPSFINLNRADEEFDSGQACPHTQTIPYVSRAAVEGIMPLIPIIDAGRGGRYLIRELRRVFKKKKSLIEKAVRASEKAQEGFERAIKEKGREFLSRLKGRAIVIAGRAYNAFDGGMNLGIPEKLASLGVASIPMDFLPTEGIRIKEDWPNMYWRCGQKMLRAARFIREHKDLYPIFIGNFSCGPDSFLLKYFKEELGGKPFLHIEIDEHSADAGAITRCEAFLDSIGSCSVGRRKPVKPKAAFTKDKRRTIFIPRMSDHAFALKAAFEKSGVPAEVLPESDRKTVELGMKYVTGKECYPCAVTTGDMLKKALSPDFAPPESAFFMPSGKGPCRFGQYNVFHRQVLEAAGLNDVPIFAPNQDANFYNELGMVGTDFTLTAWKGIVAIELLKKCLHETRPYEMEKGASERLYDEYLKKIYLSVKGADGRPEELLRGIKTAFEAVQRTNEGKPLIGIVGEIFVRSNRFSNEDLIAKIEALGGEVWLAPVEEWIYYVNYTGLRQALRKKDRSAIINTFTKRFFQKKIEKNYAGHFEGFLKTLHEPSTKSIIRKAAPYVHDSFEGETILSIGKAVDLIERGASGVVNAMPFGCMPGTIVTALLRALSRDFSIPCISIPYDGTESPAMEIQLEAFMDQAKSAVNRKQRKGV